MVQTGKEAESSPEYNTYLLITGVLAGVGGLFIFSLIALLWMLWVSA